MKTEAEITERNIEKNAAENADTDRLFVEGPVLRTILKFALPTVLALLVNSLYNITDQLFVSRILGVSGNAVTHTAYPVSSFIMAVAAMLGDGTATYFSLHLGKREPEKSAGAVRTMLVSGLVAGLFLFLAGEAFLEPLFRLLGVTETTRDQAEVYVRLILCGAPFVILGTALAGIIRADGSPRYAVFCLVPGCVFNIVFDAVFMVSFNMGILGAALATVLGQLLNFCIALCYLPKFRTVRVLQKAGHRTEKPAVSAAGAKQKERTDVLKAEAKPERVPVTDLLRLGIAGFVNQAALVLYTIVVNRCLVKYGAQSVYGADIPLAGYGIQVKVSQLSYCFLNGISAGMQPVLSYNYGRGNIIRVKKCLKTALIAAGICGTFFFALYEIFPVQIMELFGGGSGLYLDYGVKALRIFLFALPVAGISIVSTGLFQAIGKPVQSTVMALARQFIFFVPLVLIFSRLFGVVGLLYASPVGDLCAFTVCIVLLLREWKQLR